MHPPTSRAIHICPFLFFSNYCYLFPNYYLFSNYCLLFINYCCLFSNYCCLFRKLFLFISKMIYLRCCYSHYYISTVMNFEEAKKQTKTTTTKHLFTTVKVLAWQKPQCRDGDKHWKSCNNSNHSVATTTMTYWNKLRRE